MQLTIVTGQKGGVGKTRTALALGAWLTQRGIPWFGIDTDLTNQTFADLYKGQVSGTTLYDDDGSFRPDAMNLLVDDLAERADDDVTVVIDVAAGQLSAFIVQLSKRRLLGDFAIVPTTIAYVVLEDKGSLSTLTQALPLTDGLAGISWLIVRNERNGPLHTYDESETRLQLRAAGARELTLSAIKDPSVFLALETALLSPLQFCDVRSKQNWSTRGQLITWLAQTAAAFDEHAHLLSAQPHRNPTAQPIGVAVTA